MLDDMRALLIMEVNEVGNVCLYDEADTAEEFTLRKKDLRILLILCSFITFLCKSTNAIT